MEKLDTVLRRMQKKYDTGVIMDLRKQDSLPRFERVPVDSPNIGELLGFGGYPRGKTIVIYGPESGGKSSLCSYLGGACQKATFEYMEPNGELKERKGMVLFVDTEHAFDLEFAKVHGFNMNQCILVQPDNGEQALDIALEFIESGSVDMVVVDSLAAVTPIAEIEADMDQQQMGLQARLIAKFFRKATALISQSRCTLVCTNQVRENFGYGASEVMPGGRSIRFYASIMIDVKRKEYIMEKDEAVGIIIAARSVKNKTAPPMKKFLLTMSFSDGFESHLDWIDYAIKFDVIQNPKQGSFILFNGEPIRAKSRVVDYYSDAENAEEYEKVIAATKKCMNEGTSMLRVSADDPEDLKEVEELLGEEEEE